MTTLPRASTRGRTTPSTIWPTFTRSATCAVSSTGVFVERALVEVPYLYAYRLDDAVEPVERALIEAGAIEATGVLYAGELGG